MDLNDSKKVKEFVKKTVKDHPDIKFTARDFTNELVIISDETTQEFIDAYDAAKEELKNKVNLIIDEAFEELESCCSRCLIL